MLPALEAGAAERIGHFIDRSLRVESEPVSLASIRTAIELAENNFAGL